MEANEYELTVVQGRRPLWQRLIAAILFTFLLYLLYGLVMTFWYNGFNARTARSLPVFIKPMGYLLAGGISFSVTKTVLIDIDKDKLVSRFCVGPFSRDVLTKVPDLDYVSVFLDAKEYYQVNLWYKGNKHYNMYAFEEKEPAMKFAAEVAQKLNLDMLDATEKGNSKWIEKNEEISKKP